MPFRKSARGPAYFFAGIAGLASAAGAGAAAGTSPTTKAVEHVAGHFVAVFRKDADGTWKLAAVSSAPNSPAGAMPAAMPAPAAEAKPAMPAKK